MVHLNNYLQQNNNFKEDTRLPLLNSLFIQNFSALNPNSPNNTFKTFMKWARRSPQLMSFLNIIATDLIGDKINFNALEREGAKEKIQKAKAFWDKNKGLEAVEPTIYDLLLLGIGYNWLGKLTDLQLKEICSKTLLNTGCIFEKKQFDRKVDELMITAKLKSKDKFVRKLRHVAASTMSINSDRNDVIGYVQRVGANIRHFETEEILEFRLIPFDGKVYPYAPMEGILSEVYLLWLITQNYVSFFENGGKPDNVFILPKEIAGSKNHSYLIDTLKKYKKIQNKHGNLVFTGDLTVQKLLDVEQQMENKDLSLYLIGILAMFYGVPTSRIPFLIGKASNQGDTGGISDSGYWRRISVLQGKMEAVYNRELWRPFFGVEMKFGRSYLQDEVRETATEMQKNNIAEQRVALGVWTMKTAADYLGIDEEEVERAQKEKKLRESDEIKTGMQNQNLDNLDNSMKEPDAKLRAKKKQETQLNNQNNNGGKRITP